MTTKLSRFDYTITTIHYWRWYFLLFLLFHHSVMMCVQEQILPSVFFTPLLFVSFLSQKYTNVINSKRRQWICMMQSNVLSLSLSLSLSLPLSFFLWLNQWTNMQRKKKRTYRSSATQGCTICVPMHIIALNICSNWSLSH